MLILPPYGLEIYNTNQISSVISRERIIANQDIFNLYSIVSNKKLPVDNELIDIIPDMYVLDNGEKYAVPPIGKISRDINIFVKVHTLPKQIINDYTDVISKAGINVSHKVVSSFGASNLISSYEETPKNYFLIDIGASSTSISLIGNKQLMATRSFAWGGDTITERIIECFNINQKEANNIKTLYGLDEREMKFVYPIAKNSAGKEYYREDLNKIIEESLDKFVALCTSAEERLATAYKVDIYRELPIILIGGGSKLHGLVPYLQSKLVQKDITLLSPHTLGARDPSLFALLGAIKIHAEHPGVMEDINTNITPVSRED